MYIESWFMTLLDKTDTGLAMNIWIMEDWITKENWITRKLTRLTFPHIRIQKDYKHNMVNDVFAMSIEDEPKVTGETGKIESEDIEQLKEYIVLNKEALLKFWYQEEIIGSFDVIPMLKKMTKPTRMFIKTNVHKVENNIGIKIWIAPRLVNASPRFMVQKDYSRRTSKNYFMITIEDKPSVIGDTGVIKDEDIDFIKRYVVETKDFWLKYWNRQTADSMSFVNALQKVSSESTDEE